jgi:hypothetical protein
MNKFGKFVLNPAADYRKGWIIHKDQVKRYYNFTSKQFLLLKFLLLIVLHSFFYIHKSISAKINHPSHITAQFLTQKGTC